MMLQTNIRQKSSELFPNDAEKQRIFLMGAAFSLGKDLSDFERETPDLQASWTRSSQKEAATVVKRKSRIRKGYR